MEGAEAIAAVLKDTQLVHLDVGNNGLNTDAKQALQAAAGSGVTLSM